MNKEQNTENKDLTANFDNTVLYDADEMAIYLGWFDYGHMLFNENNIDTTTKKAINMIYELKGFDIPFRIV